MQMFTTTKYCFPVSVPEIWQLWTFLNQLLTTGTLIYTDIVVFLKKIYDQLVAMLSNYFEEINLEIALQNNALKYFEPLTF